MSFGNIKKKKRLLALLLCTILAGASFMTGCGSKADENGSAQVSAEEKNVTETQEQTEAESEQIMTEATETAQTKTQETEQTEETEPAELAPTETRETEEIITTEVIKGEADSEQESASSQTADTEQSAEAGNPQTGTEQSAEMENTQTDTAQTNISGNLVVIDAGHQAKEITKKSRSGQAHLRQKRKLLPVQQVWRAGLRNTN